MVTVNVAGFVPQLIGKINDAEPDSNRIMEYQCPFCDYTETSRQAVEAHISGSTDNQHAGKVGRSYRSDVEGTGKPETIREQIFGPSPEEQSSQEEIDRLRKVIESVRERNEDLHDRIEELEEREIPRLEAELAKRRDETEKVREVTTGIDTQIDQLLDRVSKTEIAIVELSGLLKFTGIDLVLEPDYTDSRCPGCQTKVQFHVTDNGHLTCPNCQNILVAGYLSKESVEEYGTVQ